MKSKFRQIAIIGKYQGAGQAAPATAMRQALDQLGHFLMDAGCDVVLESDTAANWGLQNYVTQDVHQIGQGCDLCLVVGGDGTMLGVGRKLAPYNIPLIGINQGRLGFITDIPLGQLESTLLPMLHGSYVEDERCLMQGQVWRDAEAVFSALAMNDVVVNRGATSGMVELKVSVDGHFVSSQRSDGLIISSATGSTAYALSAGGPLLHPSLAGWVMVPIAPHTLSNRPIVLSDRSEITIEVVSGRDASANFDMQSMASLLQGDRIVVTQSQYKVRFLHPLGWTFFDTLRHKMHWNEGAI